MLFKIYAGTKGRLIRYFIGEIERKFTVAGGGNKE
jgi:hypothetical protein